MNQGITIAGTAVVDHNKIINDYPDRGLLTKISNTVNHIGGCVPNTSLILKKLAPEIPVKAISTVGNDNDGKFIIDQLKEYGVNVDNITMVEDEVTGFTDVMTVENTGERTFFTYEGANEVFSENYIPINELDTKIFHIGYVFLLKQFDKKNDQHGTNLAKTLKKIQEKNIKTSIDLVSVEVSDYREKVLPALHYTNYFIANEVESGMITGIDPYGDNGKIDEENVKNILLELLELGVNDLVIIHSPEGGWAIDKDGNLYYSQSLQLPKGYIKSTVGAGDAFCAGMLYSIYNNIEVEESLKIGNTVAAMGLGGYDSFSTIESADKIKEFTDKLTRKEE